MGSLKIDYSRVAWCYDEIAACYSLGAIARARRCQLRGLSGGDRVLFAGVGRGADALHAARLGAHVTCADVSRTMLDRVQTRLAREGLTAQLIHTDVFEHAFSDGFDAVVANFFLNLFADADMRRALGQLCGLVRPGGKLLLADFAPPGRGRWQRIAAALYYRPVNLMGRGLGLCALHPIYDYTEPLEALGFEVFNRQSERLAGLGPALYESLAARRIAR